MLNENELAAWYQRLNLTDQACKIVGQVRSSEPARRVSGGRSNVSGLYPSRKMGKTIQFESHRVELAAIYEMEHDPLTLEFYDQPPSILLDYKSESGRRVVVRHTPDFFVLRHDTTGWEEWKTEEELNRLAQLSPNRYKQEVGSWRCPPGEAYANQSGLYYRVRSSGEINWRFQRNVQFIEDYIRFDADTIPAETQARVVAYVCARPAISLSDLLQETAAFATADDIHLLIASGELYVDLYAEPLTEPAAVRVFPDKSAADSSEPAHVGPTVATLPPPFQSLRAGATVTWDGRTWKLANVGDSKIALLSENGGVLELSEPAVESLIRDGRIKQSAVDREHDAGPRISDELMRANEKDLRVANHRVVLVRRHLSGEAPLDEQPVASRTIRRWISRYRAAESQFGAGYLGLLPRTKHRGNYTRRLSEQALQTMNEVIDGEYETVRQRTRIACWAILKETAALRGLATPSYSTFCRAVRCRSRVTQTLKRQGPRAAYQHEPFYMELNVKTPRHGDRPFEICHVDHTQLDIELTDTSGKYVLGRPWLTLMMDAFSRRALAVHVDFEEPSYRSCMMILRECVRRHSRLPQCLVVDGGSEFRSTYFDALLARYECTKKTRPPAKARFGSVVEKLFGTTNTQFVYNFLGNTQITRNVRQVTKSVNPRELAVWPLAPFIDQLCRYLYDIYDMNVHPSLGESPRSAYDRGFQTTGSRLQRLIRYDREFMIATLPSTSRGTALVSPGHGVKINYIYYWADAMNDAGFQRQPVAVRFDPFDIGTAYAFIGDRWVECHSDYYRTFQGRSQKELLIVSKELRAQNRQRGGQFQITASRLAHAFQSANLQESLLLQRLRAREGQLTRERDQQPPPDPLESQDSAAEMLLKESIVGDGQVFESF